MNSKDYLSTFDYFEFENTDNTNFERDENHYHNNYEIYYLKDGVCRYFIDDKIFLLSSGDIALIPSGVIHKTNYDSEYHSRMLINCNDTFISDSVKKVFYDFPHFAKCDAIEKKIEQIFYEIEKEYLSPDKHFNDIIKSKITELLVLISRQNLAPKNSDITNTVIDSAINYIRKNYSENISLQNVAKECFVSPEHLSRTFKKKTGFGFNEYLTIFRLKKANSLFIDNPKAKISDVAFKCGFNDSNYFSKVYKKIYNTSPTITKKSNIKKDA